MACMEHECRDCGFVWFDNSLSRECPRCGLSNTSQYFDEDWEDVDDDTDYEEQDDDEYA